MSINQAVLLTDYNIELIVGQLRAMLQKHQLQIDEDISIGKLQIPMNLTIEKDRAPRAEIGYATLEITYHTVIRKDKSKIQLEDSRQGTLITMA